MKQRIIKWPYLFILLCIGFLYMECSSDEPIEPSSISGKVTDSRTGEPLKGVTVSITPNELNSRITGSDGYYEFQNLTPDKVYTVQGEKENYRTNTKQVKTIVGKNTSCDFSLTPSVAKLEVSQLSVDLGYEATNYSLNVINNGNAVLHWAVSEDTPWLTCMPTTGEVAAGNKQAITLNVDRSGMSRGNYTASISFTSTDGGGANVTVKMSVQGIAVNVSPEQLDFGTATATLQLTMTGGDNVNYTLVPSNSWILPSKTSGTFSKTENLTVAVNRTGLAEGDYTGSLSLRVGEYSMDIPVRMSIIPKTPPTVSLLSVENITDASAQFHGAVLNVGSSTVTRYGFCWGLQDNPEIQVAESCNFGDTSDPKEMTYTTSSLTENSTYYVRAYAENLEGISYSAVMKFVTLESPQSPVVETGSVNSVESSTAQIIGSLLKIGHDKGVTQYGHVWSTYPFPTTSDKKTELGTAIATGPFTSSLTGLYPNVTYHVRAYATNALGTSYGEDITLTTKVGIVTLTTTTVTDITHNAITTGGNISDLGGNSITERGVCWGTLANPSLNDNHTPSSDATDRFTVRIEGLTERTAYHVRSYVKTAYGEIFYGNNLTFSTTHEIHLPQADMTEAEDIGSTSVTFRSSVTSDGDGNISDCGFCYSHLPTPTISDNKISCGKSTSTFSKKVTGLSDNTIYYVRAYVINEAGTAYGEEISFTTLEIALPSLSAVSIEKITHRSASFSAQIVSANNGIINDAGFVYSINHNPELTNHKVSTGTNSNMTIRVNTLSPNTTYYVRAYATNEKGTGLGEEFSFTTEEEPEGSNIETEGFEKDDNLNENIDSLGEINREEYKEDENLNENINSFGEINREEYKEEEDLN